jgi:hypothetical protein
MLYFIEEHIKKVLFIIFIIILIIYYFYNNKYDVNTNMVNTNMVNTNISPEVILENNSKIILKNPINNEKEINQISSLNEKQQL